MINTMLVSDLVRYAAVAEPDKPALVFDDTVTTFGELHARVNRLANGLLDLARPGDRVAILAENLPEYIDAYYGVPRAGMALTFLNYRLHPREIHAIIDNAGAEVLIVEPQYLDKLEEAGATGGLRQILLTGDKPAGGGDSRVVLLSDVVGQADPGVPSVEVGDDDLAWLIYTSGTTGLPKGVMLSHRNLISAVANSVMAWERGVDTLTLMPWPLCHVAGYGVLVNHANKRPLVLMRGYEPEAFLSAIQHHRITDCSVAPTMLSMLLRHPRIDEFDVSSVRRIGYGAAAMPIEVLRQGMAKFPNARFFTGFGMTELGGNVLYQSADAHLRALDGHPDLLASVGRAMPLGAVRVVDDQMNDTADDEVGELVIRAPQVTMGYWRNPEATAEAFSGDWFHSGDLARRDPEGNFYIVDRKKDMILTGGENVYSREVEEIIYRHPSVAEAAVVGEPDEMWGEIIVAVVQLKEGATGDPEGIVALCRDNLAGYKKPRKVVFVDEMPRNAAGKILKRELRRQVVGDGAPGS